MTSKKSRSELEIEYGRRDVGQSLVVWSARTKPVEKDKAITDIVVGAKDPSEAWKIPNRMVEDDSGDRARELAKKQLEGVSMNDAESMKDYSARAKSLALNVKYHDIEVSGNDISRRVLNGLPPSYASEKRNFALKTDFSLAELVGDLVRVEELNRSSDGTDGSHALAAGFKARSGGRGKRDGKGRPPNQRQPQHQPRHQRKQQPAHQPQQQQYQPRHQREHQPAHQQQYQQRHQQYQQQEPQQQYQRYQPRHQPQQPAQHSGGRGPSRVCFRCGKHGYFLSECRAVPPTRFPDPYAGVQAVTYSYSEDYADLGSVPSESSSSSFSEQATLAQFAPPGTFHVPSESVVGDVTVPGSYLYSAFVVQSGSNEDDVLVVDSGASCHMTYDRTRMYNVRPPPPGREAITIGDHRRI